MAKQTIKRYSKEFGKKEKVLNYATQTYQLSRPNKVGAVMALIRECQPKTIEEWEKWYFENATTDGKAPTKITKESLEELGERLYVKIKEIVIPDVLTPQIVGQNLKNNLVLIKFGNYETEKEVHS